MKTPKEIKKGLECCTAIENEPNGCPYGNDCVSCLGVEQLKKDALALIREYEVAHRTEYCESADYDCEMLGFANMRIQQLERERDALLDVIRGDCCICDNYKECIENDFTIERNYPSCWQWRGVREVE